MKELKVFLGRLYDRYHSPAFLGSDPLEFVHHYKDPQDQEAVALVAALLAYGNVIQIRKSISSVLRKMHEQSAGPSDFVQKLAQTPFAKAQKLRWKGPIHRLHLGSDLLLLLKLLSISRRKYGSLGAQLAEGLDSSDRDFSSALNRCMQEWKAWAAELSWSRGGSFYHLLSSPEGGSVCKRWSMLLRWMVRKDGLDLGLWSSTGALGRGFSKAFKPNQLILPLDTHTGRISRYLGLTDRRTLNWKAAREITDRLMLCDPLDPVRYDFALSRLGILDLCKKEFRAEVCGDCDLLKVCRYSKSHVGVS